MDPYYKSKEFQSLLQRFEDFLKTGSSSYMDADELTDLAEYYHLQGQIDKGWIAIDMALKIFPGATLPLAFKARYALLYEQDVEKATELTEQISDKSDLEYRYIRGEVLIADKKARKADKYFAEYDDDSDEYYLDITNIFSDYGEYDLAAKWLKKVRNTTTADYKELQAQIFVGKGRLKEGEKLFNELLDEDPYSTPYWNQLATTQMMNNRIQESITSSEFSIAIDPNDGDAVLNKANGLFNLGNYKEAAKFYGQYAQLCPDIESGPLFQGLCLINTGDLPAAVGCLEEAERRAKSPKTLADVYQELAFAHSHLGHVKEAIAYVDKAKKLPCNQDEMTVLRGHVYLENGEKEKALKEFEKAALNSDGDDGITLKIAVSAYDCGYQTVAFSMLNTLLHEVDDDWTEGFAYLARCSYELGNMETYDWALAQAVEKNPTEARIMLADLYPEGAQPEDYPKIALR